jgi:hypothetical protein
MAVNAARSDPPTPKAQERARAAQRREQEKAARKKEKRIRRRERRERRSEEFRLSEQQGLSSPGTLEYSSSDEEEGEDEDDGGRAPPERWEPSPPSPRAVEAVEEAAPGAGAGTPAARHPTGEAMRASEAPARAVEMAGGAAAATPVAATTSAEPPRKKKRGFSTLR